MNRRPSIRRPSEHKLELSNMNVSESRRTTSTEFDLKHQWGGGLAALGFGPDQIRTLVAMITYSSHRIIIREML